LEFSKFTFVRKLHKKQILDLLKTLDIAVSGTKNLFLNRRTATLINILADCQDGVANISEFIKVYGENTKILQLLAEFSETLYKTSVEINENKADDNFTECLKKQLAAIENCAENELEANKIEAVFLPYKASMWDSLESIYLSAKNDPACDAFVVPIPYYDKKDGKLTEMHWETKYPKNIPLTDYRKYNIEERHPDIIFIHNPYDSYNTVTNVHPDFYSEKLRNLTDCLVYVPYFVGNGRTLEEHFCTLPACIFAHKVIAQTKEEREIYIRVYKDFAKRNNVPERLDKIGDKFLALGCPKLDKAVSVKSENCEIPEEWEKRIRNTDGTRKKVVFYNTSIGSLLLHSVEDNKPSNRYLQKLKTVFEFFKKQSNAVLLWRPHPLLEGTIKSMRPWLEQEYAQIVNEYKTGNYGIYDNTEDLNRSIAISDMYYGDGSSVATLFSTAEKPVLGQAIGIPAISALYDDGISVWFMDSFNALYKHDKQNRKTEYMATIPIRRNSAFTAIAENNKKLYLTSAFGYGIFVFDMAQKQIERNDKCNYGIQNAVSFKNFVYFIPQEFSAILRLDAGTNEIAYFSPQFDIKGKVIQTYVAGTEIAMIIQGTNAIVFFNMESGEYIIEKIGTDSEQYNNICFDGHNYYLSPLVKNYIVKWNRKQNKISKIKFPDSFSRRDNNWGANFLIQYSGKHLWLFPFAANNAYKINTNTEKITELPKLIEHFENKNLGWYYNLIFTSENFVYASTWNKGIIEFNTNTSELNFIKPSTAENLIEPSLFHYLSNYEIPSEWERLIKNTDGTCKKVVFYNASVSALLESSTAAKENNAVLLWRPCPWFEQKYAEIVKEYKTGNHGICDYTENLNRAVAVSDVYYGDASNNVTALFYEARKTVLALEFWALNFVGFYDDRVYIWFINVYNTLYKYNKQSKEIEYAGVITGQNNWGNTEIAANNKKLYFTPLYKNDKISFFDMAQKSFKQIDFKDDCEYDRKFKSTVSFKNFVYFIPQEFPAIMRLNTDTNDIEYFSQWVEGLSKLQISILQEAWKNAKFFSFCIVDEEIAMTVNGANAVMFFNMKTCNYEINVIGEKSEQYNHICFDGQNYYLTPLYKDYIVKWNRQSNEISKIKIPSFSRKEGIGVNFIILYLNEYVWLFPHFANNAYKININTNEIAELPELLEHFEDKNLLWYYNRIYASENTIYAATQNKGFVEYNTNTSELNFIKPVVEVSQLFWLLNNNKTAVQNAGEKIWEHLKEGKP
jgi:hypothetical protein